MDYQKKKNLHIYVIVIVMQINLFSIRSLVDVNKHKTTSILLAHKHY